MDCRNQKKILQIKKKQGNSRTGNIKSTATEVGECSGGHRISFCFFVFPFIFLCVCVNNVFFCLLFFFCLMLRRPTIRALMDRGARLAQSRSIPSDPVLLVVSHSFVFFVVVSWFWVRFRGPHLLETGICGGATVFFIVSANEETETTARALLDDIFGRFSVFFRLSRPNHKVVCRRPRWMRPRTRSRRQSSPSRGIPCVVSRGKKEKKRT